MQGTIVKLLVAEGDSVEIGQDYLCARGDEDGEHGERREGRGGEGDPRGGRRLGRGWRRRRRHRVGPCADPKDVARAEVDSHLDQVVALSHAVHAHPELCFEEHWSAEGRGRRPRRRGLRRRRGDRRPPDGVRRQDRARARSRSPSAPSTTPSRAWATPAGTTSSPPAAVGAAIALGPLADELGLTVGRARDPRRGGGRRQGPAAQSAGRSTASTRR